jgi:hypothetical protein
LNVVFLANKINPQNISNASILPNDYGSHILDFSNDPNISIHCSLFIRKQSQIYLNIPWYYFILESGYDQIEDDAGFNDLS